MDKKKKYSQRGDKWDQATLKQLLQRNPTILYNRKSNYQDIILLEGTDIRLYLNNQLQFSSLDERFYHEALVHPAMTMASQRDNVLIVGGGDGFALREVLKYSDVKSVDLVELDPQIIQLAKDHPISTLNEKSMFDKRVAVYEQDARKYLKTNKKKYQVIVIDFPDPADREISKLYTKEFFKLITKSLDKKGIIVCQSNSTEDAPLVYWSIYRTIRSIGLRAKPYYVYVPSFGDWGFHLASFQKLDPSGKKVAVPNQTLPRKLSSLFKLPEEVLAEKSRGLSNSLKNLRLHRYYRYEIFGRKISFHGSFNL